MRQVTLVPTTTLNIYIQVSQSRRRHLPHTGAHACAGCKPPMSRQTLPALMPELRQHHVRTVPCSSGGRAVRVLF